MPALYAWLKFNITVTEFSDEALAGLIVTSIETVMQELSIEKNAKHFISESNIAINEGSRISVFKYT